MNRRNFVRNLGMAGVSGSALMRSLGSASAFAQSAGTGDDYKALVCVYLYGGNDANNMLVPIDGPEYKLYAQGRGALALQQSVIRPLAGGRFGVHPSMPGVQTMYNAGQLAVLANVGALTHPITKAQYIAGTVPFPQSLMSHSDQQQQLQTGNVITTDNIGWGGKLADQLTQAFGAPIVPMCTSMDGSTPFINGLQTQGFLTPGLTASSLWCPIGGACYNRNNALRGFLNASENNALVAADQAQMTQMLDLNVKYGNIMSQASPLKTQFKDAFQQQFENVAQMIHMRRAFQTNRQIFFVGLGSFDTHGGQLDYHANMLQTLDGGLQTFANALQELGLYDKVTTFTLSDFSRTLQGNPNGGSDHAWGSHHLIMGGAVKGGSVYGTFPTLDPTGADDLGSNDGRWIPTTSIVQMGASLASWLGVPSSALSTVFPLLPNFPNQQLTFL